MKRYNSLKKMHSFFKEAVIHVDKYLNILRDEFYTIFDSLPIIKDKEEIINFLNNYFYSYNILFKIIEKKGRNGVVNGKCKNNLQIIIFCSNDIELYFENKYKFSRFLDQCIFVLSHELVHRGQYIQMNKHLFLGDIKNKDIDIGSIDIKYYSNNNEIMAFANMIIEELRYNGYSNKEILNGLKKDNFGIEDSEFLELYRINFRNNRKVINKLYKYIYEYLKSPIKIQL